MAPTSARKSARTKSAEDATEPTPQKVATPSSTRKSSRLKTEDVPAEPATAKPILKKQTAKPQAKSSSARSSKVAPVLAILVLGLALSVGYSRYTLAKAFPRRGHKHLLWLEASKAGDQNAFRIVERGDSNGGQYMVMHEWVRNTTGGFTPGLIGSPFPHVHPGQVEYFKVIEGTAGVHVNGTRRIYAAGKVVAVPQGVEHFFWNADTGGNLLLEIKLAPAMQSDVFFEQLAGLCHDYGSGAGSVNKLQMFALLAAHDVHPNFIPAPVWSIAKHVVGPLAQLYGFKTYYPEYDSAGGRAVEEAPPAVEALAAETA